MKSHDAVGVEWKTLNAAQKQLRRDMMPLYGTPRPLLRGRVGFKGEDHAYGPMFLVQVQSITPPTKFAPAAQSSPTQDTCSKPTGVNPMGSTLQAPSSLGSIVHAASLWAYA